MKRKAKEVLKKANETCKEYKEIIEMLGVVATLMISIISLRVSQTAVVLSEKQADIMQQELKHEETKLKPVFDLKKSVICEEIEVYEDIKTPITTYVITNVGGDVVVGDITPISLVDVYYDDNYITSFSIDKYLNNNSKYDKEQECFLITEYSNLCEFEEIERDLLRWIGISADPFSAVWEREMANYQEEKVQFVKSEIVKIECSDSLERNYTMYYYMDKENRKLSSLDKMVDLDDALQQKVKPYIYELKQVEDHNVYEGSDKVYGDSYKELGTKITDLLCKYLKNRSSN